tara:strand:+ start:1860 stop:2513 length:654 start_codon:yes stop_codon:yes gene_type:complete
MGAYTKLQAINEMLLFSGETPVSDLSGNSGVDTSIAESILNQKTTDAQARGLADNITIRDYTIASDGRIELPSDILSANMISLVSATHKDVTYARVVTRGWESGTPYFYNLTDSTDVFKADTYTAEIILSVAWDDLITSVQKDIMMQAARQYQMLTQGDAAVDNYLAQLELYYGAKSKGADTRKKAYNILNLNTAAHKASDRQIRQDPDRFRYWKTN